MKIQLVKILSVAFALGLMVQTPALHAEEHFSPRLLVHLLDYLAKDYGGAVQGGKVISDGEYAEQIEFSKITLQANQTLKETQSHPEIQQQLTELNKKILGKASAEEVAALARKIQADIITVANLQLSPQYWPDLKNGQALYQQTCVTCHGAQGRGDGPAGVGLDPKPANFMDTEAMEAVAPFQEFNTIRLGVPGTGMVAYTNFSDKEIWDLAFYVVSLRHADVTPANQLEWSADVLKNAATQSDEKLKATLLKNIQDPQQQAAVLASIRVHSGGGGDSGGQGGSGSLEIAEKLLDQSVQSYGAGNVSQAKSEAIRAYLEGIEPIEPQLKAIRPEWVISIETTMAAVRSAIENQRPQVELNVAVEKAKAEIAQAKLSLNKGGLSPWVTFLATLAILFREGFEAVLIIIALLGVIRASKATRAARWVHGGWIAALGLGFVAWFFSGWLISMSGASREMMEAVTSLLAVLVLLVVGFWLHSQTEIGRWHEFIGGKVQRALEGKNKFGLAGIAFVGVFREAFETVLFLRAVWLEGGDASKNAMVGGVAFSLVAIFALTALMIRFSTKIPVRQLFTGSAVIMGMLALILTGKGIHSLQESGVLPMTLYPIGLRFDLLGFYPTLETLLAQIFIFGVVIALWIWGKKPSQGAGASPA